MTLHTRCAVASVAVAGRGAYAISGTPGAFLYCRRQFFANAAMATSRVAA